MNYSFAMKKPMVVFRRWNNKRYAVFNSLKRSIKIGALLIAYLKFVNMASFAAVPDTTLVTHNYELESIDISAEPLPEAFSNLSRAVVTISQREIERAPVSSLNELLEFVSNIDIRQRGSQGIQADISIRGSSFDQVLILLNGVNISDPQTGHHNLNLPIDLSAIDRIEIIKGPGSSKFGPGAFGGAINFITKKNSTPFFQATAEIGSFSSHKELISAAFNTRSLNHFISASFSSSEGYVENTDYDARSVFYQTTFHANRSEMSFQMGLSEKNFGANNFYSPKYAAQFEETRTVFSSFHANTFVGKLEIEPTIFFRRHNDHYLLVRHNPSLYNNYHTTDVWGSNVAVNYYVNKHAVTSVGFDGRTETIWSNRLGELLEKPLKNPENDSVLFTNSHSRSTFSAFLGQKLYFSKLALNVSLNVSRNSDQALKWFFFPGVDIHYSFTDQSTISASLNKTMRMPTFTDLYYSGPLNVGNTSLLPEKAIGYELGYSYKINAFQINTSVFYSTGTDLIDWVKKDISDKWHTINYSEINTLGGELSARVYFDRIIDNAKFIRYLQIDYTYLTQQKVPTDYLSNYSLNYLKHRFDLALSHTTFKNIFADWHFAWQDRNGQYEKYENGTSVGLVNYSPFSLLSLKIGWQAKGWKIYGMVDNIFNTSYYDIGNIEQPGRCFFLGLSKKVDFR